MSSPLELLEGTFQKVLDDPRDLERVVRLDVALIRIEQLYPPCREEINSLLLKYHGFKECFWVQEEPHNQGPYASIAPALQKLLPENLSIRYVGRRESGSTAAGWMALHLEEKERLLKEALE